MDGIGGRLNETQSGHQCRAEEGGTRHYPGQHGRLVRSRLDTVLFLSRSQVPVVGERVAHGTCLTARNAVYVKRGFRLAGIGKRLKSRSDVQSSEIPCDEQIAAIRASCTVGPLIFL